jgi:hypothetical protein
LAAALGSGMGMLGVEEDRWRLEWEKSGNGGGGGGEAALRTEAEGPASVEMDAAAASWECEATRLGSGASPWAKSDSTPPVLLRRTVYPVWAAAKALRAWTASAISRFRSRHRHTASSWSILDCPHPIEGARAGDGVPAMLEEGLLVIWGVVRRSIGEGRWICKEEEKMAAADGLHPVVYSTGDPCCTS